MPFQNDASTPYQLDPGAHHAQPITIVVDTGAGGTVEIQFRDHSDAWFTPDDPEYTIDRKTAVSLENVNTPERRIIATGDARFLVTEGQS